MAKYIQIGWMTRESKWRLAQGGNGSRGSVPIHPKPSTAATIAVYIDAPKKKKIAKHPWED